MPKAPSDRFVPCADPVAAWKDWAEHLAPIFEARPVAGTHVGDTVAMRTYNLGPGLVGEVSAPAQKLVRSAATAARQGVDHVLIQLYRSGSGLTRTERGEHKVDASDFVVYDLAQPIEVTAGPVAATNILLPRALVAARGTALDTLHGSVFSAGRDATTRLLASYLSAVVATSEDLARQHAPSIAEAAACLVCAALPDGVADQATVERRAAIEIRGFIQEQLATPDLGAEAICARFGLSRATLYRQFEADGGVQSYIRTRRLAWAMRLLTRRGEGPRPRVSSVAYATGFADEKSFSRAFKRQFGVLPREASIGRPPRADAVNTLGAWVRQLGA